MALPRRSDPAGPAHQRRWSWQLLAPSWLVSLVVHALLVVMLGYVVQHHLRGTNADRPASLVASYSQEPNQDDLFDDEQAAIQVASAPNDAQAEPKADTAASTDAAGAASDVFSDAPPVDVASALPSTQMASAGAGAAMSGLATDAGAMTRGGPHTAKIGSKQARTGVYGIDAEGNSFVYVFDRSASMGTGGGSPLASAKSQLLASLDDLSDQNQFQIIFYNEKPHLMHLGRQFGGLAFADEWSKGQARKHVAGIIADGGTNHYSALQAALSLKPDVIFFLTDADEPGLPARKLEQLARLNGGRTSIHTIEFGRGYRARHDNFLARIARQNDGRYVYIDITRQGALQ
jgi:hypothetical protein